MSAARERASRLFAAGTLRLWLLAALPLWAVLVFTGCMDPAQGFQPGGAEFAWYLPASALIVLFSMALNLVKGFLVLWFGKLRCGMLESGRRLARVHAAMLLLEAAATLILFLLRSLRIYPMLEQAQLFGHELIYAALLALYLRAMGDVSPGRAAAAGMLCFLASSAWLLLSVIVALL